MNCTVKTTETVFSAIWIVLSLISMGLNILLILVCGLESNRKQSYGVYFTAIAVAMFSYCLIEISDSSTTLAFNDARKSLDHIVTCLLEACRTSLIFVIVFLPPGILLDRIIALEYPTKRFNVCSARFSRRVVILLVSAFFPVDCCCIKFYIFLLTLSQLKSVNLIGLLSY